ncbi:universal stress protein [Planomonospora venezuelensis]
MGGRGRRARRRGTEDGGRDAEERIRAGRHDRGRQQGRRRLRRTGARLGGTRPGRAARSPAAGDPRLADAGVLRLHPGLRPGAGGALRGRGPYGSAVLGSVGHGVLHRAHCPVAVVRPRREER